MLTSIGDAWFTVLASEEIKKIEGRNFKIIQFPNLYILLLD